MHGRLGGVIKSEDRHLLQITSATLPANTFSSEMTVTYDSAYIRVDFHENAATSGGFTACLYVNDTVVVSGGRPSGTSGSYVGTLYCFASKGDKIKYRANVTTVLDTVQEQSLSVSFI